MSTSAKRARKPWEAKMKLIGSRWLLMSILGVGLAGAGVAGFSSAYGKRAEAGTTAPASLISFPVCLSDATRAAAAFSTEMMDAHKRMHHAMEELAPTGDSDRDFIRAMIPHHQGAIDMAQALLKVSNDERIKRLAQSMIIEQAQEIAYMRMLLLDRAGSAVNSSDRQ